MRAVSRLRQHRCPDPVEVSLSISPTACVQLVDVTASMRTEEVTAEYPRVFYSSLHTTAGYLEQRAATALALERDGIAEYLQRYLARFPPDAGYQHDALHLRTELTREQQLTEPKNAHAHLVYIASGLSPCVRYVNRPGEPVHLVELDGVHGDTPRERSLRVVGYSAEEAVAQEHWTVPIDRSAACIDLAVSTFRLYERLALMIRAHNVTKGRVLLTLAAAVPNVALTVNEYEPLLIVHDLARALRSLTRTRRAAYALAGGPTSRMPSRGVRAVPDSAFVPEPAFMEASSFPPGLGGSSTAARRSRCALVLRRRVSLLISDYDTPGFGRVVRGQYQSPILMRLGNPIARSVALTATVLRFV